MDNPFELKTLTDNEFNYFRDIVYRETGIKLNDMKRSLLQSRLMRRMRELKLPTYELYAEFVENNFESEIFNFINAVTTNKTEFFREHQHFDMMTDEVFPEFEKSGKRKIRLWSAGCSTGEEPYSLAMTIKRYFGSNSKYDIKILATDIDTQVLSKAIEGIYTGDQIVGIGQDMVYEYFSKIGDKNSRMYKINEELRKLIVFKRLNLLDEKYPMKGRFDCIMCRNVIIYFDKSTQKILFERFYDYLNDDGFLFVGHSENLSGLTSKFTLIGKTVYKKAL
jgi:chemotaxis protein methyltransferase CheR